MKTTQSYLVPDWTSSFARLAVLAGALAAVGCSSSTSPPPATGPTGVFRGTLVGSTQSGVLSLTFPGASGDTHFASSSRFSLIRIAEAATTSVSVTGTFTITGGGTVALTGSYDANASPQLTLTGGGYTLTGNYTASSQVISGSATLPGGSGLWTVSAGGAAVRVFCGTYTSTMGHGGGTWNVVLDSADHLSGVATAAGQLQGTFNSSSMAISVTYTGGTAAGTLNPSTGGGSGTYNAPGVGNGDAGTWAASTSGC